MSGGCSRGSGTSATGYRIRWRNPSRQTDGTRLDDLAGIRILRDGALLRTLTRTAADTARIDSTTDNPPAGLHTYAAVAIDNELPVNASVPSNTGTTPLDIPFTEFFPDNYPARTVVQVVALVLPQLKLEVQATAVLK